MDKRKKYFCVMAVVLILLSGYGKVSDSAFRMQMARMIAGKGKMCIRDRTYRKSKMDRGWRV